MHIIDQWIIYGFQFKNHEIQRLHYQIIEMLKQFIYIQVLQNHTVLGSFTPIMCLIYEAHIGELHDKKISLKRKFRKCILLGHVSS